MKQDLSLQQKVSYMLSDFKSEFVGQSEWDIVEK